MRWELSEIRPLQREECLKPMIGLLRADPCRSHSTGRTMPSRDQWLLKSGASNVLLRTHLWWGPWKRGTPEVVIARTSPKTEIGRIEMTVIMMDRSSGPR